MYHNIVIFSFSFIFVIFLACKFDFEDGIDIWEKSGTAFSNQPTYGDNPPARFLQQPANQQGDWWIGTYEDRPAPEISAGRYQGDGPQGTLTSPPFTIKGQNISFLIGGSCNKSHARAELVVDGQVAFHLQSSRSVLAVACLNLLSCYNTNDNRKF